MDSGISRQSRLLSRLLSKLRGDNRRRLPQLDKQSSVASSSVSENLDYGSNTLEEDDIGPFEHDILDASSSVPQNEEDDVILQDNHHTSNFDLRYSGQYLTPDQLPEFCDQLHNLVDVIRNIQAYAQVTGEYPRELERRLEQEAREVVSLAAEARNARDVVMRVRTQRRALRENKQLLIEHLASLKETEIRELESTVRLSDRKLFKSWEALKDSKDPSVFEPLLAEIKNKQTALDCLVKLIDSRRSNIARATKAPHALPPPLPHSNEDGIVLVESGAGRKRSRVRAERRRRMTPRSGPMNSDANHLATECTSRYRVGSAGAMTITPLDLTSRGSVRDLLFFTIN